MELKNIKDIKNLIQVDKAKAEVEFLNNKTVYVALGTNQVLAVNFTRYQFFPFDETTGAIFYIVENHDTDKVIVCTNKNVRRFFKEELGINAKEYEKVKLEDIKGKTVYGTLPMAMMHEAKSVISLTTTGTQNKNVETMPYSEFKKLVVKVVARTVTEKVLHVFK